MLKAPTAKQLATPPTHEFLSSTGEWYACHIINFRLILITDSAYPLPGISKFTRLGSAGTNTDRLRRLA